MGSASAFLIRWINFFTMILALLVVGFGFWMSTHNDACRRSLTIPVMGLGGVIFVISLVGFLGAWKNVSCLLWTYLIMLFVVLVAIMVFTVLAFIITNTGTGHAFQGLVSEAIQARRPYSYGVWLLPPTCRVRPEPFTVYLKCGYPAVNASYFDLSYHPVNTNVDCKLYKNTRSVRCYDCNSCKAGVAQYMKEEWRVVAIFNVILFVILSFVYFVGCCARRNAGGSDTKARGR
ncbi:hypothetical protein PR202_ga07497 [Eleusine coracana subsp. coracana]|uniref:Tetraspanin-10 n=1 Tax=Eleusine coracana subsp. coracana TaxID=191504 RepID=A0AAV5BZD4_ELECO|nr:hypothetical protein PR202_ga07497 [Eleusine coracana subsp. coracana]